MNIDEKLFNSVWDIIPSEEEIMNHFPVPSGKDTDIDKMVMLSKAIGALWMSEEMRKRIIKLLKNETDEK